ncbi:DUF6298 domain-containing protein [Phocaeicola sp.]
MKHNLCRILLLFAGVFFLSHADAHFKTTPQSPVHITESGELVYKAYPNGDRVPDFSYCGYRQSESPIPWVEAKVYVPLVAGDATAIIQKALDYVASLPKNTRGFRGAVQLAPGKFELEGKLLMRADGVVLRGSGAHREGGTVLRALGLMKDELIRVFGYNNAKTGDTIRVSGQYVPVNATVIPLQSTDALKVGDRIRIIRPSTAGWLSVLGTDKLGHEQEYNFSKWIPGRHDMRWERTVVAVTPESVTIDVPLTMSLDPQYGGGYVLPLSWTGRINNVGIENLCCDSEYDTENPKDENHRWQAIAFNHVKDGWVRRVEAHHFAGSAVMLLEGTIQVTVEDCKFLNPISEIANHRRYAFHTLGQLTLFQRCYSEEGYRDFTVGVAVPGPNAFVQCHSERPYSFSGSTGGFSNGILMDKITLAGGIMQLGYRDMADQGSGWVAANSMCWQGRISQTYCDNPPTAHNWAYGMWTQPFGSGHYELSHTFVKPESFFYAQLSARMGKPCMEEEDKIFVYTTDETVKPTIEYARWMSAQSVKPDMRMDVWIDSMVVKYPLEITQHGAPYIDAVKWKSAKKTDMTFAEPLQIKNGWIVRGNHIITNGTYPRKNVPGTTGWQGTGSLSQFVPGRTGTGFTEEPDSVAAELKASGAHVLHHRTGLWYERRRNDHERNMHADAEVWAPFNEMPYSRSGQGEAQDRLSKYDLNKFNPWYWNRLKQFVDVADREGLVLMHDHYNQHNIIEEGAHWCDYPWRSANNINHLGFAEKTVFSGDKRVYMAEQFYDITRPIIREYHSKLIRHSVNTFHNNNGVVHSIGLEYTGPLHFMNFWLEEVNMCTPHQLVALTATKDVQDAVLKDEKYRSMVDIIDIRQWHYREDGTTYEPKGGLSLAPRQHARLIDPGKVSCTSVYRAVREYRRAYPDKAVIYNASQIRTLYHAIHWAIFMAGGSFAKVPPIDQLPVYEAASDFAPMDDQTDMETQWVLGALGKGYLVCCMKGEVTLDLTGDKKTYSIFWIDPDNGTVMKKDAKVKGNRVITLKAPVKHSICFLY